MKALILAAGYGTRLYPLTKDRPKPLLPIAGRPIIEYILEKVQSLRGLDEVLIVSNKKFFKSFQAWAKGFTCKKKIRMINDGTTSDRNKLGAIGDIDLVIRRLGLKADLLVVGGDNLFDFSLDKFVKFARSKRGSVCVGLYDVKDKKIAKRYGIVDIDKTGEVVDFAEKPKSPKSTLAALAVYYLPKESFCNVAEFLKAPNPPDAPGHYINWLYRQGPVYGYIFKGRWYDIGDIAVYRKANREYQKRGQATFLKRPFVGKKVACPLF